MKFIYPLLSLALLAAVSGAQRSSTIRLEDLDLSPMQQGWGTPQKALSVSGKRLTIGGKTFDTGLGTHAQSECWVNLDGGATRFRAQVGVDDAADNAKASVEFAVYGDGRILWQSPICRLGEAPRTCDVDIRGVKRLLLYVRDAGDGTDYDHADWADATFEYDGARPQTGTAPRETAEILTPPDPPQPQINGPKVIGVRPGSAFLFRIPTSGERPIHFSASGLPRGLALDPESGVITGAVQQPGEYKATLIARNANGQDVRSLRVVVGPTLALTPPMGWNSWYIHYHRVSDPLIRQAADAMVSTGMVNYGYQYVNIDDCWMRKPGAAEADLGGAAREPDGTIRPNDRFPDMRALTDYIHAKGLKAGIYTSPGPLTCGGYEGSFGHEEQDAKTFAGWGFDFLKYDWCSYGGVAGGETREHRIRPYRKMGEALKRLDRDMVFNLCQYGTDRVWEWGAEVGGNCWRTTGDLGVEGGSLSRGIYQVGLLNAVLTDYAGPGHWNDPDYLLIGLVGDAAKQGEGRPTTLTPNEQYSHMSLWSLMAAPLIFSGDMTHLDPFTLHVLCNHEIIDVNQDALGQQARVVRRTSDSLIVAKPLEDGSMAVGLFNLGPVGAKMSVSWTELGLPGPQSVRDLWRHRNLGVLSESYDVQVARHGVAVIRLSRKA